MRLLSAHANYGSLLIRRWGGGVILLVCVWALMSGHVSAVEISQGNRSRVSHQAKPQSSSLTWVQGRGPSLQAYELSDHGTQRLAESASLALTTPLGSLWKLFVYAYLSDTQHPAPPYVCKGQDVHDEVYCCTPGNRIERERALVQSCGLFFEPQRLGIQASDWRSYWRNTDAPDWLLNLSALQADTLVNVGSLMQALAAVPENARQNTMQTLLAVSLEPSSQALLQAMGSTVRVKTWSWHDSQQRRVGGFGGWLLDGTPVWLRGLGTSATVIPRAAPWLASDMAHSVALQADKIIPEPACVSVWFFKRYPLARVQVNGIDAAAGPLRGPLRLRFVNGQTLSVQANGQLHLIKDSADPERLHIEGRFGLNDYVARVIHREGSPRFAQAARALGVAARTYVVKHADFAQGCYRIDDDSRTQRVSPNTPTAIALSAAFWSDGLVLAKGDGRYHATIQAPGQMAWAVAQDSAEHGANWDEILQAAYGSSGFRMLYGSASGSAACKALPYAQQWLSNNATRWQVKLRRTLGFEPVQPLPQVCSLGTGLPYADLDRQRIFATGAQSATERLTLAHEYLHFGFRHHPLGRDEAFVEHQARVLLGIATP